MPSAANLMQQAHSPGHRPGYVYRREVRPARAKSWVRNACVLTLLPLQGAPRGGKHTQGNALGYALVGLSARSQDRTRRSRLTRLKPPVPPPLIPFVTLLLFLFPAPLIYVYFFLEKSFNPSALPSFSLIIRGKVAEGFGFQTLQEVSAVQVAFSTHAVFGPS